MTPRQHARVVALWLVAAVAAGCAASDLVADTDVALDAASAFEADEGVADLAPTLPLCDAAPTPPDPAALGIAVQAPSLHHVVCSGAFDALESDQPDVNWLCTFDHAGTFGVLYLPARPVSCHWDLMIAADYETPAAFLAACGQSIPLENPHYDWGGNHHNDFLTFDLGDHHYQFFHSSFDAKWRSCQPPDCLKVYDAAGETLQEDGCTRERTLPVVCVKVADNGSVPPLIDTFARCQDDG